MCFVVPVFQLDFLELVAIVSEPNDTSVNIAMLFRMILSVLSNNYSLDCIFQICCGVSIHCSSLL